MASQQRFPENGKSSLDYWWVPLEVQPFKPNLIVLNENLCAPSTSFPKGGLHQCRRLGKGLIISKFRSAASGILTSFLSNECEMLYDKHSFFHLESGRGASIICPDMKTSEKDIEFRSRHKASLDSSFGELKRFKKILLFASCNRSINSFCAPISDGKTNNRADKVASMNSSQGMEGLVGNMISMPFFGLKGLLKFTKTEPQEMAEIGKAPSDLYNTQIAENIAKAEDTDLAVKATDVYKLGHTPHVMNTSMLRTNCNMEQLSSNFESQERKMSINSTSSVSISSKEGSSTNYQNSCVNTGPFCSLSLIEDFSPKPWLAIQSKFQHAFSNNRHAIAGALAGTLVTLCLHPIDTVKTIIQANEIGQKSFYRIVRRIISQHGIFGLYRGIASNITSSAPISAIYTFTYESVKCTLLPLLPMEYHSLAHCIAGGCSSVATSFVFTPSERIKQQMQVGSQYQNCWNALIGCLQKGGIPSLYAGWGAVLCRNIPHSIIKFYTYERLKQFFTSAYPDSNLKTFHTLVCGGLAGSTAALFTTPFDVVKTRLQTQPPGSIGKYHGVFHALQEIARQEGFPGLYRGLAPRLAMYVSQGAIFFASYEFLKAVFLLETLKDCNKINEDEMRSDASATPSPQTQQS